MSLRLVFFLIVIAIAISIPPQSMAITYKYSFSGNIEYSNVLAPFNVGDNFFGEVEFFKNNLNDQSITLIDFYTTINGTETISLSDFITPLNVPGINIDYRPYHLQTQVYDYNHTSSYLNYELITMQVSYHLFNNEAPFWSLAVDDWRWVNGEITGGSLLSWPNDPEPVPEPATFILFGTGLFGLAWYGWKRNKA